VAAKKILIVDDEQRMRKLVSDFLIRDGYETLEAENGKKALELFREKPDIDLIIIDVMMPEYDGWTVCRQIRKTSKIPVIMLTARSEESDELFGFELGADEYITKPFSPKILVARVNALLRRVNPDEENGIKLYNGLEINNISHLVTVDNQYIDLSPKEYELLFYLVENKGRALSRDQILNNVWKYDYFGDLRTVDTHINRLRIKLGPKCNLIQTVRGLGYRFEVRE